MACIGCPGLPVLKQNAIGHTTPIRSRNAPSARTRLAAGLLAEALREGARISTKANKLTRAASPARTIPRNGRSAPRRAQRDAGRLRCRLAASADRASLAGRARCPNLSPLRRRRTSFLPPTRLCRSCAGHRHPTAALVSTSRLVTFDPGASGIGKTRVALSVASEVACDFVMRARIRLSIPLSDPSSLPWTVAAVLGIIEKRKAASAIDRITDFLREPRNPARAGQLRASLGCRRRLISCRRSYRNPSTCTSWRQAGRLCGPAGRSLPKLRPSSTRRRKPFSQDRPHLNIRRWSCLPIEPAPTTPRLRWMTSRTKIVGGANRSAPRELHGNLELAAARIRALGLTTIERRLDQRFELLSGGDRVAPPRQQTLQALIAWSYR